MISTINVATQPDRMEDCAINSRSMDELDDAPPQAPSVTANADKLSGQLIIKAQLGDDIRKMMIHNEDLTLNGKSNCAVRARCISPLLFGRIGAHDGTHLRWQDF